MRQDLVGLGVESDFTVLGIFVIRIKCILSSTSKCMAWKDGKYSHTGIVGNGQC